MEKGVSVVICTYNGRKRLIKTLEYLVRQKLNIPCEIVLVDNASTDGTKEFVDFWWEKNGVNFIEFKTYCQEIPGKSYAQELGYKMARYEYIIVCDDDNWLCDTYIRTAYEVMESDHKIGALGGWCEAVFEDEKPTWFDTYARYFAVSKQGKESGDITNNKGCLYGAGMVIRKSHWIELKSFGFEHQLSCRKGNKLSSGGDTEYSFALRLLGYLIWFDERLYFKHFMDSKRLNLEYVSRLRQEMVISNFTLSPYHEFFSGNIQSRNSLIVVTFIQMYKHGLKNILSLFIGNYSSKENAKLFFRLNVYRMFQYSIYQKSRKKILKWKPSLNE